MTRKGRNFFGSREHKRRLKNGEIKVFEKGEKHLNAKLTEQNVLNIRKVHSKGNIQQKDLAKYYNVSASTIGFIINRINWKHI